MDTKNATTNRDFLYTIPSKVMHDKTLSLNDIKVYMIVRSFMDTTGSCYASNNWIANNLGIHRTTVIECIKNLIQKTYLIRTESNGQRYLSVNYTPYPEDVIVSTLPPSSLETTPPSSLETTQYNSKIINTKKIIATSDEVSTTGEQKPLKPKPQNPVTRDNFDVQPYIDAWNNIAATQGSPRMGTNKRQIEAIIRNLKVIQTDWECKLTVESFSLWLKMAIESNFYMITKDEYQKTMDVVTRWPHFYEAFNKGKKILEKAQ